MYLKFILLLALPLLGISCGHEETFDDLGLKVAGPTDVATSADGKYFYILNSDFDRTYNQGSILVVDEDGKKIDAVATPRMGRAMTIAGNDLIVVYDKPAVDGKFTVQLFDLSADPKKPNLVRQWESDENDTEGLNCLPINAQLRAGYQHFVVTCAGGEIFIGTLKTPRSSSTLKLVRRYTSEGRTRRALYIDAEREMLLAFPTDYSFQKATDLESKDIYSYNLNTGKQSKGANQIPDEYEDNAYRRRNSWTSRYRYQMLIYNIAAEREKGFPLVDLSSHKSKTASTEQRWIYFTLFDADGTPDTSAQVTDMDYKLYRTNFWSAQPDPLDNRAFYLSHRGKQSKAARFANNIVHVKMLLDPRTLTSDTPTDKAFSFTRAFGDNGEIDKENDFPTDFRVLTIAGQLSLVINHFKDFVNFRKEASFGITAKPLGKSNWRGRLSSTSSSLSYYQVAVNQRGKALSCAFYGNAVIPLEIKPGTELKLGWDNLKKIE